MNLCLCGCGNAPSSPGSSWLPGHNVRVREYAPNTHCPGCGKELPPGIKTRHACSSCRVAQRRDRLRQAKALLGNACVRCGIAAPLHLDHINDDGYLKKTTNGKYRPVMSSEQAEITRILKTGRSDRLQLLCPNCNHLKAHDREEYDRPPTYGPLL